MAYMTLFICIFLMVEMWGIEPQSKICPQQNSFTDLASISVTSNTGGIRSRGLPTVVFANKHRRPVY